MGKFPAFTGHSQEIGCPMYFRTERLNVTVPKIIARNDDEIRGLFRFTGRNINRTGRTDKDKKAENRVSTWNTIVHNVIPTNATNPEDIFRMAP